MPEEIYDPRERLEIFLNAVRTGDVDDLPDPQTREEMYLAAIASKSALPDTADASVGDALVLDSDKTPVWGPIKGLPDVENPAAFKNYILDAQTDGFGNPTYKWKEIKGIRLTADGSNYINNSVTIYDLYDYLPLFVYFDYLSGAAQVFFDIIVYGTVMYPYSFIIKDRSTGNTYKWDDTYTAGLKFVPYTP